MLKRAVLAIIVLIAVAVPALAERRVALVMAADDYETIRPLKNAVNDARAIGDTLEGLGFDVVVETDRNLKRMRRALDDFREDAAGADVALVFFAGHGIEISGDNRLLPVDADASSIDALKASSLPLEEVRDAVASVAKVGLIVLDACRNDPLGGGEAGGRGVVALIGVKEIKPGLGRMGRAENILFAFSAAPGQTAADGADGHSPFNKALAKYLGTDGLEIRSVLTLVQQEVYDLSRGAQLPYVESGLPTLFFASSTPGAIPERERLLLAMADITPDIRSEIEGLASRSNMPLAPLYAALIATGAASLDSGARGAKLEEAARAFVKTRDEMRQLSSDDPEVAKLRDQAETATVLGAFDTAHGYLAQAAALDRSSRTALKDNFVKRTLSEAATHFVDGGTAEAQGSLFAAMKSYQKSAVTFAEVDAEPMPPEDRRRQLLALQAVADTDVKLGALSDALDAIALLRKAAQRLVQAEPGNAEWLHSLSVSAVLAGDLRVTLGDADGALAEYGRGRDLARQALQLDSGDPTRRRGLAVVLNQIGNIGRTRGDLPGAMTSYSEAISLVTGLLTGQPGDPGLRRDLSFFDLQLGEVQRTLGDLAAAQKACRAALAIRRDLLAANPGDAQAKFDVGVAAEAVGETFSLAHDPDGALPFFEERHRIITALVARSPDNSLWRRDLSVSHEKLGDVRRGQGDDVTALAEYWASHTIMAALAASDPANMSWQRDLTVSYRKLGEMLLTTGDASRALEVFRAAQAVAAGLAARDPGNLDWQYDLAIAKAKVAGGQAAMGKRGPALAGYRAALAIMDNLATHDPGNAGWQWDLFASHFQLAEMGEAPRDHYAAALQVVEKLAGQNRLAAWQEPFVEKTRTALATAAR